MNTILLSVKPEYSEKIFNGVKKFEYRKSLAKKDVNRILIYTTSPIKLIIGEVEVIEKISLEVTKLWAKTQNYSGISKKKYLWYFNGNTNASAYKLGKITKYETPKTLDQFGVKQAPQSFVYIK
ncbi:ASCH domain-containing protein [Malacoplasma iowae]|uniref:ASCH domain-containing protein n=1 Tax=Malacoplasma iowae TaxID=2116 RepID=UPI0038739EC8|nr:hypothetical protein QX181_04995 [Malacoplasma iowae]